MVGGIERNKKAQTNPLNKSTPRIPGRRQNYNFKIKRIRKLKHFRQVNVNQTEQCGLEEGYFIIPKNLVRKINIYVFIHYFFEKELVTLCNFFLFNRDLNRGCLVYMFSLRFSGSKFLKNLQRQFRVHKIFSCT